MFVIILLVILVVIYFSTNNSNNNSENFYACGCKSKSKLKNNIKENFYDCPYKFEKYSYDPPINTPQSNYDHIMENIDSQQIYKKDLSVALAPTPTIHCPKLYNKADCNKYGCNWFGSTNTKNYNSFCSSTYPTQI